MRKALGLGVASMVVAASVASAANVRSAQLGSAVRKTATAASMRYVMNIVVVRSQHPATVLHIRGARGPGQMFVHVQAIAMMLADGTEIPGPSQSALLDGPFLYEGAPNGVAVSGAIRWLRVPVARLGQASKAIAAMRNLSPAPLLRAIDEARAARSQVRTGTFKGAVRYDDPIVRDALTSMTGGIEFRDLRFEAKLGSDGLVHAIKLTGRTADGGRVLSVIARLYAFGRAVHLAPPAEGTFMDQKSFVLAD
jgi:hypothetical protein